MGVLVIPKISPHPSFPKRGLRVSTEEPTKKYLFIEWYNILYTKGKGGITFQSFSKPGFLNGILETILKNLQKTSISRDKGTKKNPITKKIPVLPGIAFKQQ